MERVYNINMALPKSYKKTSNYKIQIKEAANKRKQHVKGFRKPRADKGKSR